MDEGKRLAKVLKRAIQPTTQELLENAKRVGAKEELEKIKTDLFIKVFWGKKEQKVMLKYYEKRLKELEL